jgi:class 3 adenylate cyclase
MFLNQVRELIDETSQRYNAGEDVEVKTRIPLSDDIPLETNKWFRIDNAICVYIDMRESTKLSARTEDKATAGIYQYFTGTAVRILDHFGASYIDVRGDGAFGLFDFDQLYHAFAAGMTFKTFVVHVLGKKVPRKEGEEAISCHIGMDTKTVLVKKIGLRRVAVKTTKQNEVWAGKPVNMAAKLASLGKANDLIASERVFQRFLRDGSGFVLKSCGCPKGEKSNFWKPVNLTIDPKFDFARAHKIDTSGWCITHGVEYCQTILRLDPSKP